MRNPKNVSIETLTQLSAADISNDIRFTVHGVVYEGKLTRVSFGKILNFITIETRSVRFEFSFQVDSGILTRFERHYR